MIDKHNLVKFSEIVKFNGIDDIHSTFLITLFSLYNFYFNQLNNFVFHMRLFSMIASWFFHIIIMYLSTLM